MGSWNGSANADANANAEDGVGHGYSLAAPLAAPGDRRATRDLALSAEEARHDRLLLRRLLRRAGRVQLEDGLPGAVLVVGHRHLVERHRDVRRRGAGLGVGVELRERVVDGGRRRRARERRVLARAAARAADGLLWVRGWLGLGERLLRVCVCVCLRRHRGHLAREEIFGYREMAHDGPRRRREGRRCGRRGYGRYRRLEGVGAVVVDEGPVVGQLVVGDGRGGVGAGVLVVRVDVAGVAGRGARGGVGVYLARFRCQRARVAHGAELTRLGVSYS